VIGVKADRQLTGQLGEFLVAAELVRLGFTASVLSGNAKDLDILAYRSPEKRAVQVKSVSTGGFQLSLNKFLQIEFEGEAGAERQNIVGRREDLDESIDLVIVFLGGKLGDDRFYCSKLGAFADFAHQAHAKYIGRTDGRRPGTNKKSFHAAFGEPVLQNSGIFLTIQDHFA